MARILVVDDDATVRSMIGEVMAMNGHSCEFAQNGSEAVALVRKKTFDLVIMDRSMPVMDGVQAVAVIRSNPQYRSLKIIMCTSASVTKEVEEAFQAGADGYVLKPIAIAALADKVAKTLAGA